MTYPWDHNRLFNAYAAYVKKRFGFRVQKVSIDAGFTCPNRDGSKSVGGCSFCVNDAFNPSYCHPSKSVGQQIEEGIEFHKKRYKSAQGYFAYFQAYSNTYAPLDNLKRIYVEALDNKEIIGIIVGTRPDCVDEEKMDYFRELSQQTYFVLELGVESCYNKTLERINRGHTFEESQEAIKMAVEREVKTGVHLILGLPGETKQEQIKQAKIISRLKISTLKLHQLQIIKNTAIAREYAENKNDFYLYSPEEYIALCAEFIQYLSPDIMIERFAGESHPDLIAANLWGLRYDQYLVQFEKYLKERDIWQGKKFQME